MEKRHGYCCIVHKLYTKKWVGSSTIPTVFEEKIEAEYDDVIYFTEVRWLSRGAILKRFFTLREEINIFMNEKRKNIPKLSDKNWILDLFFITITTFLNYLNVKLQGKEKLLPDIY